jgi:hypothetical protein
MKDTPERTDSVQHDARCPVLVVPSHERPVLKSKEET